MKSYSQSEIERFAKIINVNKSVIDKLSNVERVDVIEAFKKGNKIHIKKENRGKFTDYCGGKVTSECIQRGKNSPDPKIRKRATFAANVRKFKHQNGGTLSQKDKDILWLFNEKFGANSSKDEYFDYWKFQKGSSEVNNFFNSYLKSKGVQRILNNQDKWWESRHPYRKWYSNPDIGTRERLEYMQKINPYFYTADMYTDMSTTNTHLKLPKNIIIVGRNEDFDRQFPYNFTVGHEYAHGKNPFKLNLGKTFASKSAQAEALNQNTNTKPGHNSLQAEKYADNWGLKYLLYKEGIYDARGDKDVTIDQIKKLRKLYPNLRPFKQMNDKEIQFQLNHVAYNKIDDINEVNEENNYT